MQRPSARESGPSEANSGEERSERSVECDGEGTFQCSPAGVGHRSDDSDANRFPCANVAENAYERSERRPCVSLLSYYPLTKVE